MTTDQLEHTFRAADPTSAHDEVPTAEAVVRAALAVAERPVAVPAATRPRRRTWVAAGAVAAAAVALAVGVPLLDSRTAPTARAAIRLAPFDGLLSPYVLATVPDGLGPAQYFGQQSSTTASYVPPVQSEDGVSVTHSRDQRTGQAADVPHAESMRREPDGSWVIVTGYGRFDADTVVTALLAGARPAPQASPLRVELAPSGWALAAFKDLQPGEGVVTFSPSGSVDDPDSITVIRYRTTAADFPSGYEDQGPASPLTSLDRAGILMQGRQSWTLQLRLADGGSLVLLLPIRMDRDQVQRFADGVTTP